MFDLEMNELRISTAGSLTSLIVGEMEEPIVDFVEKHDADDFVREFAKAMRLKEPVFIWDEDKPFKMTLTGREEPESQPTLNTDVELE